MTDLQARALLNRLKPFEEWSRDEETMAYVQQLFGSPRAFYAQFKKTLEGLCERPDGPASFREVK